MVDSKIPVVPRKVTQHCTETYEHHCDFPGINQTSEKMTILLVDLKHRKVYRVLYVKLISFSCSLVAIARKGDHWYDDHSITSCSLKLCCSGYLPRLHLV
jgi:hypothetical protein